MIITAYLFGAIILYITIWLCYKPLKAATKIICHALIGSMALIMVNFSLGWAGVNIGINAATSLISGILGIPGIGLLVFLQRMLV